MPPIDNTQTPPLDEPTAGGSYIRHPDGTLEQLHGTEEADPQERARAKAERFAALDAQAAAATTETHTDTTGTDAGHQE